MRFRERILGALLLGAFELTPSCGEGFIVATFDLVITSPTRGAQYETSTATVSLSGSLEFTLGLHDGLDVDWHNLTTGASGGGTVNESLQTWNAGPVPLQEGPNVIRVELNADGNWDDEAQLTVVYTPGPSSAPAAPFVDPQVDPALLQTHTLSAPAGTRQGAEPAAVESRLGVFAPSDASTR
jgi:hypothetical protein